MRRWSIVLVLVVGCDSGSASRKPLRQLGSQPLVAEVPDDAGIKDINVMGPDDGGFHGASVTLHAQGNEVEIIQDTTQGRRWEDAHIRNASMEDELNGMRHVTRTERLADGWIIERTVGEEISVGTTLEIKPGTERYAITVHRTIAGTPWACEFIARTRAELAEVERLCRSISAAPTAPRAP